MKYFKLESSLNKKEIGNYPQIQDFKKGYDDDRKESCSQIARYYFGKRPDVEIDFDCLELANKARLTDYISSSYLNSLAGLLVSDNLFSFFSGLRVVSYISYKAPIYQKGNLLSADYRWIHFIERYSEMINYPESDFFLDNSEVRRKKISIRSFAEYENEQDKAQYAINSERLVLRKEIAEKFDVLRIGVVRDETYVTETVKNEMINKGFTGIVYRPADYLIVY
jgi:hypothetical protein